MQNFGSPNLVCLLLIYLVFNLFIFHFILIYTFKCNIGFLLFHLFCFDSVDHFVNIVFKRCYINKVIIIIICKAPHVPSCDKPPPPEKRKGKEKNVNSISRDYFFTH